MARPIKNNTIIHKIRTLLTEGECSADELLLACYPDEPDVLNDDGRRSTLRVHIQRIKDSLLPGQTFSRHYKYQILSPLIDE